MDQVHFLVHKLLKGKLRVPSRIKRCIKWNLSPDMNSTKMMQLCLRKRLEHDYERRKSTIGRSQLSILLLVLLLWTWPSILWWFLSTWHKNFYSILNEHHTGNHFQPSESWACTLRALLYYEWHINLIKRQVSHNMACDMLIQTRMISTTISRLVCPSPTKMRTRLWWKLRLKKRSTLRPRC